MIFPCPTWAWHTLCFFRKQRRERKFIQTRKRVILDGLIWFEVEMSYPQFKINDNQVVIEKLGNTKDRIVRQSFTYKLNFLDNVLKQRCLVCDKLLLEIKPENGTKIRIKCKGCLVINEITYSIV